MRITRGCAIVAVGVALTALGGGTAWAAQPVAPACVGASVSAAAQQPGPFGGFVSDVARDPASGTRIGLGDELQALAAGQVSDLDFPNSCNDG